MPDTTARIPMTSELAELIGANAQHVANRSLLLDKFVFHKNWGLNGVKANDASRWSLLRISEGGTEQIAKESHDRKEEADRLNKKNKDPDKVKKLLIESSLAKQLASSEKFPEDLATLRAQHTRRFLGLFRKAYGERAGITIGRLEARLAINLADGLIQNAGICLDRLFGLPFIPGSAIKGVCRHAALEELAKATDAERQCLLSRVVDVFGATESDFTNSGDLSQYRTLASKMHKECKGAITFLPAYPVNEAKIVVDLTNVHYPDYYRSGKPEDQSKEKLLPNPFPAVEVGTAFAFCQVLTRHDADPTLLTIARRWLESALTERGLGAKTAAGYGWFSIDHKALEQILADQEREAKAAREKEEAKNLQPCPEIQAQLEALPTQQLAGVLNKYAFEQKFWPSDSTTLFELTLFEFVLEKAPQLLDTKNGKKAMRFLSEKLSRPLP